MKNVNQMHSLKEQINRKGRRKWYYTISVMMVLIAFFCTVYAPILPAITLEKTQEVLECPLSVHQHTAECRDENGALICGQADFVIHTHNENCYNADGTLVCKLPELAAHEHTDDCYETQQVLICTNEEEEHTHDESCYQTERTLVCKETAVLHIHDATCHDENGMLTCGILQVTEHTHDAECFQTVENTSEADTANDIMPVADTANGVDGGYNADGSILGSSASLQQITDIEENTPYIIAGNSRMNVLTNTSTDSTTLTTARPDINNVRSYKSYEIWYFKKIEGSENEYLIYDGDGQYLKLESTSLSLTSEGEATAFTVKQATRDEYNHCITMNSNGYYLNTYKGDTYNCSGWAGWNDDDDGSCLQILKLTEVVEGGYNDDGSIWWNSASLQQIANIEENTPYIITGNSQMNVLTNTSSTDSTTLTTARPGINNVSAYKSYEIWYFKKIEGSENEYLIYDGDGQYLKLEGTSLSLTSEGEATAFTVKQATRDEYNHCITMNSNGYYLNTYQGDTYNCSGWAGWNDDDDGSCLQILKLTKEQITANPIKTTSSPNTVINMFDYWVSENQYDPDNVPADLETGINQGHALKFVFGDQTDTEGIPINRYTGRDSNPLQGVVANKLVDEGYPALSGLYQGSGNSNESLEYLFNPTYDHPGKQSYRNVTNLFNIDDQGYYSFDCTKHAADLNEDSKSFSVYDTPSTGGQFFPFNKTPDIATVTKDNAKVNHYFGATITTRFIQQHNGYTNDHHNMPITFEFSGDDDVWIFIDGVLVGDLGGIHDKASVDINFSTGEVEVGVIGGNNPLRTTLKECYVNAGKYNPNEWIEENGHTTYKDNTVHTLKFFYLERGNYESNMQLKYNLTTIPQTAIYKVDQYGEAVPGATFAVYAADADYRMLDNVNGNIVSSPDSNMYDDSGNLLDSSGNIIANALYTGITDQNGEMMFVDQDDMTYSINELNDMFGDQFILREIKVPDGYRVVTKDVHLQIWKGDSQKILRCVNSEESGSRAASYVQITATDTLYLQNPYNGQNFVQYYNEDDGTYFGTMFAVVFRYVGAVDANGKATELGNSSKWVPIYGNDKNGYNGIDMTGKTWLTGALEAVREAQKYGDVIFSPSPSGTMQLTMKNLPGNITTYYQMLPQDQKDQARYTVAYYWTNEDSLDKATAENIHRVYTFASAVPNGASYSGFERIFGADIQVPNLINRVFVQKADEKNNLLNGATFAIYEVKQLDDGTIQYLSEDGEYHTISKNAVVSSDGVISEGNIRVNPLKTDVTRNFEDNLHIGTAEFDNLSDGQYIIKEVNPPPGYKVNTSDVMVLVTEDTIYANAGTENDGIIVGRGPGYLVDPLNQFASEGQIDNTLTWVYSQMQISKESTSFADAGDKSKIQGYIMKNYSSETTDDVSKAFKTYLKYAAGNAGMAFDYVPDQVRNAGKDSDGYRRVFTTVGWSYYEIYQDYAYGSKKASENGANYEDWSDDQLTNLFSRSTYIRIMDEQKTTLKLKKVDAANTNTVLAEASFRLYKMQKLEDGTDTKLYYFWNSENETAEWSENANDALIITTGEDGMADNNFTNLVDGEYYLEEVKSPDGYCKLNEPVKLILEQARLTLDPERPQDQKIAAVDNGILNENNLYTYTVTVYNYAGIELPATGGSGTIIYIMGGILLMAFPLVYVYRKKRRSE